MAIITISRGTFSGGADLAKWVAEKLGYRCIAREVLTEAAKQYGADEKGLQKALTEKPGFIERLSSERTRYLTLIQAALCNAVKDDKVVYHGHAGHLLLLGVPHLIRVRVIANMDLRIASAMHRQKLGRQQAIEYIRKMDDARAKWTKFLYHVDWQDPLLYDLVINLDNFSLSVACEVVCAATKLEVFQASPESQKIMDDLALSTDVKARIISDPGITTAQVEVEADNGIVTISGTVGFQEELNKIKEIARNTPDVRGLRSTVRIETHWALTQGRYAR